MREFCGDYWLRIGESSFSEVFSGGLVRVERLLFYVFSTKLFSLKRLVSVLFSVGFLYLIYLVYLLSVFPLSYSTTYKPLFQDEVAFVVNLNLSDVMPLMLYAAIFTLVAFAISLSMTIFFVSRAVTAGTNIRRIMFMLLDVASLIALLQVMRLFAILWLLLVLFQDPQQKAIVGYSFFSRGNYFHDSNALVFLGCCRIVFCQDF